MYNIYIGKIFLSGKVDYGMCLGSPLLIQYYGTFLKHEVHCPFDFRLYMYWAYWFRILFGQSYFRNMAPKFVLTKLGKGHNLVSKKKTCLKIELACWNIILPQVQQSSFISGFGLPNDLKQITHLSQIIISKK